MNPFLKHKNFIYFLIFIEIHIIFAQTHRYCAHICLNNERCLLKCLRFQRTVKEFNKNRSNWGKGRGEPEFYSPLNEDSLNSRYCGKQFFKRKISYYTNGRIIGGFEASENEFPWVVSLQKKAQDSGRYVHFCGGAIINDYFIVTAAHCAQDYIGQEKELRIVMASNNISDESKGVSMDISEIIVHENWDKINDYNDIALYKTKRPIKYKINEKNNQYIVNSICLPESDDLPYEAVIAGWGRPVTNGEDVTFLRKVTVSIFPWNQCKQNYQGIGEIDQNMMCYGGKGDVGSCMGDSGGPLMELKGNKFFIIGIVSYGVPCALKFFPTVYIKVSKYIDWFHQKY